MRNHVLPHIGSKLLADVTYDDIAMVMAPIMDKVYAGKMAPRTAKHVYANMFTMFKKAGDPLR